MTEPLFEYNPDDTWEYNLIRDVRWGSEDAKDDVVAFIRTYLPNILAEDPELVPGGMVRVTSFDQITAGESLLIIGEYEGKRQNLFHNVKKQATSPTLQEVILQKKNNVYFNFGMYVSGDSWVEHCFKFV